MEVVNVLFSQIIAISRKDIQFFFSHSVVNDMLACQPFRKLRKTSKCLGEVNKTKISSTYHHPHEKINRCLTDIN